MKSIVSVIIPTKNEERNIARCLQSIKSQNYKEVELIVIDNRSIDRTQEIARNYTKLVFTKGPERSTQRNYGAEMAKGKYLLFIDADMELTPHVLEECIKKTQKLEKTGGIFIPEVPIGKNFYEKSKAFERSLYNKYGDETTDAARFFKKEVFNNIGGYDTTITGPEDWDITDSVLKAGYTLGRIKAKIYHYEYIPSAIALFRKKFYYAKKAHRYLKKQNISTLSPKTVYFLRPIFYKSWKEYLIHPLLFLGMVFLLSGELVMGSLGFFIGKFRHL
jgi:glycosyltransferase involved in cell wall biosynthesis